MDNLKKALEEAKIATGGYKQAIDVLQWCIEVVKDFDQKAKDFIEKTEEKIQEEEKQTNLFN
jgi:hypothetical protein